MYSHAWEIKKEDLLSTINSSNHNKYKVYTNKPQHSDKSESGTHGGELVAVRNHINSSPLPENIYEYQLQCYNLNVSLTNFNKKANNIVKQNRSQ